MWGDLLPRCRRPEAPGPGPGRTIPRSLLGEPAVRSGASTPIDFPDQPVTHRNDGAPTMNTFPATRDPASQRPTMSPDDRYAIPPLHRPFHRPPAAIWSETAGTLIDKYESAQVSIPA